MTQEGVDEIIETFVTLSAESRTVVLAALPAVHRALTKWTDLKASKPEPKKRNAAASQQQTPVVIPPLENYDVPEPLPADAGDDPAF